MLTRKCTARDASLSAQSPPRTQAPPQRARSGRGGDATQVRPASGVAAREGRCLRKRGPRCRPRLLCVVAAMCSARGSSPLGAPAAESSAAEQVRRAPQRGRGEGGRPRRTLLARGARRGVESRRRALAREPPGSCRTSCLRPCPPRPRGHVWAPGRSVPVTLGGWCSPPAPRKRSLAFVLSRRLGGPRRLFPLTQSVGGSVPCRGGTWPRRREIQLQRPVSGSRLAPYNNIYTFIVDFALLCFY